jgi:hypothetical protein
MYGIVEWLNAAIDLGKIKKGQELITSCFVFKAGVVLMCKERIKQKKKKVGGGEEGLILVAVVSVEYCMREPPLRKTWEYSNITQPDYLNY